MTIYPLENEAATLAFGAVLASRLKSGMCIALKGDLGAGKTTLVRGLIQSKLGMVDVPSPTYTLVQTYEMPGYELWHCDLYRLESAEDVYELGLIDSLDDIVSIVEWPERMGNLLPVDAVQIEIVFKDDGRVAKIDGLELSNA